MLSIIIPVYNTGQYLPQCLDSILAMGLDRLELILVDDGSTDSSGELCRKYQQCHQFIRVLSQKNMGPSLARNQGLELASGKYIAFFDSDDYITPHALRRTLSLIEGYPDADLWVSDFCRVADNGCVLDWIKQIADTTVPIQGREYLPQFLTGRDCVWNIWRYLFRRDFLLRNGLRFVETASCAEDLEYIVRVLSKAEKPVFFHNPYYFYRVNYGSTLTRRYTGSRVQELSEMLQQVAGHLQKDHTAVAQALADKIAREYILNLALLRELPPEERPETRRTLQETGWIMDRAGRWQIRVIRFFLSSFGIDIFSRLLYRLKCLKRKIRGRRSMLHPGIEVCHI